ncbi:MAG: DUF692 domain-containing protein [Anaerolineales bacterium]|nr:DUF692 domain-containing protein [Anaerolineales bacterium]
MKLAVNYSEAAAALYRRGQIDVDYFKCPAWPALVDQVRAELPTIVHFPLVAGAPGDDAYDSEIRQSADWNKVERMLATTATRHVNLHLAPEAAWFPAIPVHSVAAADVEHVCERMVRTVEAVVRRFGPERVIVENDYGGTSATPQAACLPETIARVVAETGCGLLLDLSHARLAARNLGTDAQTYMRSLPVHRLEEIHITGVRRFSGHWLAATRRAAAGDPFIERYAGEWLDHLPMTTADWRFLRWATGEWRRGAWRMPWVETFEYGGVSAFFLSVTDERFLAEQVPRLRALALNGQTGADER